MTTSDATRPKLPMRMLLRSLRGIERAGNKLPHPFWLFIIMAVLVILLSAALNAMNVSAESPDEERIEVESLISAEGMQVIFGDAVDNFATFPPLAIIIAVMLGVSVAEQSGMLNAMLRGSVSRVPAQWLTFAVALTGVTASVASDAAYVVLIPLGALLFKAAGRSPVLGLVLAFTSASAGYNASLLITPTDALLSALTTEAAGIIDADHTVTALDNYFFTFVSAIVLAALITLVTEYVLSRRTESLAEDHDNGDDVHQQLGSMALTAEERRGLRRSGLVVLGFVAVFAAALAPSASPLRGEAGTILGSPVITGVAYLLGILFLLVGIVYGRTTGSITRARDVPEAMAVGVRDLAPVVVLFFAASQFLAYFDWTGIGEIVAISGAEFLEAAGVHPVVLFLGMILFACLMNILITSGSAQWALIAPIFVPMFMLLNVPPETTQAIYRIADSSTNIISPMSPYFVMALGFLQRYRKDAGIGTLISLTLPISVTVLVGWTLLFLGWWALGIPLGPGVDVR